MPERIVRRARNYSPNLYFTVPFRTKAAYHIERGDRISCVLERIVDSDGNVIAEVGREVECRVAGRDGRFYAPPELIQELNMIGVEYYVFTLNKIIKRNGKEVEIYPGELIERKAAKV